MSEKKMTSSRKHHLKSLVLQVAAGLIEAEGKEIVAEKARYMAETCPPLNMPSSHQELMEYCKKLGAMSDKSDEERYDVEAKVLKAQKEIEDLKFKVMELQPVKKPALKKVRLSADAMLAALLGSKHKVTMDLRSNLKQVKKEVKEEDKQLRDVGDWRKNIEDKSDMGGRKKMFESDA